MIQGVLGATLQSRSEQAGYDGWWYKDFSFSTKIRRNMICTVFYIIKYYMHLQSFSVYLKLLLQKGCPLAFDENSYEGGEN